MSATPQPNCIHRTSLPSRSTACTTPFPCKRRVVLWGLDRQEWLRFSTCTAPQRLHCEYTDKQPAHNAGEETQGADDSALSTGNIDKQGVDHGEIHSTDHNRDAHPQVQEHNDLGRTRAPAEPTGQGVDIHQDSTLLSVNHEGQHANALHGDVTVTGTESTRPIEDDGGATTLYSHQDTEWTETADEDSESAESEQLGEVPTIDRSEDRGQELQGTKIAAAPDLMGSRPAMLSAPLESADDNEEKSADAADSGHTLVSTADTDVSTAAADLPALPEALQSPKRSAAGTQKQHEEPDGRSLNTLLPLKPGATRGKAPDVGVTATRTPDGTMFSFEPKKKKSDKVQRKGKRARKQAQTQSSATGLSSASSLDSVMNVESIQTTNVGRRQDLQGKGQSPSRPAPPPTASPTTDPTADTGIQQRDSVYEGAVSADVDDGDLSGDEEFMLIQMEADDSIDSAAPVSGPAQQIPEDEGPRTVTSAGPTSPFTPSAPEAFFKDVDVDAKPADKRGEQEASASPGGTKETGLPPSISTEPPQTIRHVENAKDTTSAPPKPPSTPQHRKTGPSSPATSNAQGTSSTVSCDSGVSASRGRFSAMMRGAGSSRPGPGAFGIGSGAGLQAPVDVMSPDSDAGLHASDAAPAHTDGPAVPSDSAAATAPANPRTAATDPAQPSTVQTPTGKAPSQPSSPAVPSLNASPVSHVPLKTSDRTLSSSSAAEITAHVGPGQGAASVQRSADDMRTAGAVQPEERSRTLDRTDVVSDKAAAAQEGAPGISETTTEVKDNQGASSAQVEDTTDSIHSHPLDDVPGGAAGASDAEASVALVRQREQTGMGNGSVTGRESRVGVDDSNSQPSTAVDGTGKPKAGPQQAASPSQPDSSLPTSGIPEMPPALRQSRKPDLPRPKHDPPTDAASAIAIAALAGAAAGIPPSGLARGFRSRRRRRVRGNSNASNGVLSPPPRSPALATPDPLQSTDSLVSIDPDDAGKDFTPPVVSSPPPPPVSPAAAPLSNGAQSSSQPEPQLSGPPLEDPPEGLIHPFHLTLFAVLLFGAVAFAITVINFTTDMGWLWSAVKVFRKLAKSLAFRQSIALMVAIAFVRYGLEPLVRSVRSVFSLPGPWERSTEYFILKQVYQPLEFLLFVAAISTVVEAVLPPLVAVQKETVRIVVRTMLSLTYVIASAFVVFNIKARIVQEKRWRAELSGDTAAQRSIEATNKLLTVLFLFVATLLGLQAIGLDIQSVLAISGFGGLALGLAGREILENVFNGLLIVSSRSFVVGEEIMFTQSGHAGRIIEGIIMDIGWYRTLIRSFEREVYIVPNSVFSRTVVLNVTRKGKEWRVFENIGVRVEDISAVPSIIGDMRRIIRNDVRVLPKLHRRVFLDKVNRNELTIYISFYIEAANRDAFMATKQEIFLEFALACERHGAQLASNRHQVQLVPNLQNSGAASLRLLSDASLDPDISQEESGSDGEELDSESSGTDVDGDIPTV